MANISPITCCECGTEFWVTSIRYDQYRADSSRWFYCPNGHHQHFSESEADRLRRERDRLKQRVAQRDDEIAEAKRQVAAAKGQVTRLRNRASAGLCPCCNRHFTNLERHMASKHKDDNVVPMRPAS